MNRMESLSRVSQKQKRKKHMNKLSFITQFKIWVFTTVYLLLLGKMPAAMCH